MVELLLQWKAHINADQSSGALCSAVSSDDVDQLSRLVENKADVNQGGYDNRTPLHLAAAEGHDKVAEYLLDHKVDPCMKDRLHLILIFVCCDHDISKVLYFFQAGVHTTVWSGRNMLAVLIRAKGGTLPADVGAMQICTDASKGDVPGLQLLHMCGVKTDVGGYD